MVKASAIALFLLATSISFAQNTLRPEVLKEVVSAQDLIKAGNAAAAADKARNAKRIPSLTPYEQVVVEQTVASAAIRAQDYKSATKSLTILTAEPSLSSKDRLAYLETLISLLRAQGDLSGLAKFTRLYLDQGGAKEGVRQLYLQALFALNRH